MRVLTEKGTGKSKGLAFVKYFRAYHSALAMEMCDPSELFHCSSNLSVEMEIYGAEN